MNTGKQVNMMLGLLMVFAIGTLLYFLWDNVRADDATEHQLEANAERGGKLYAVNCRACHGLTGKGALENPSLPGAPLNIDANRPTDVGKLTALRQRFRDTIRCGRVGTLMPPWSQEQGGPLNDFQIEQLVLLITSAASQKGWEHAVEVANYDPLSGDNLNKRLAAPVSASDTVLTLNDARRLSAGGLLRIDDVPTDEKYELVKIVDAPVRTTLLEDIDAAATEVKVQGTKGFRAEDIVEVDDEKMKVTDASGDLLRVGRGVEGTQPQDHRVKAGVFQVGDKITVERGFFGTQAAEHQAGTAVFAGPILPPTGPLTGESGTPPCGQRGAAPAASPAPGATGAPVASPSAGQPQRPSTAQEVQAQTVSPSNGVIETEARDSLFSVNNFAVKVGEQVTIRVPDKGQLPHNLRIAGLDGQWDTADDFVTDPVLVIGGAVGELKFSLAQAATLVFRCDVHPTQMWGQITVAP